MLFIIYSVGFLLFFQFSVTGAGAGFFWRAGLVAGSQVGRALGCSGCLGSAIPDPVFLRTQPPYATNALTIFFFWQAMSLYWAVSALLGLTQNVAFKFPAVRRLCGIPRTPSESEYPIRDLQNLARLKREEFLQIQREGRPVKKGKWRRDL